MGYQVVAEFVRTEDGEQAGGERQAVQKSEVDRFRTGRHLRAGKETGSTVRANRTAARTTRGRSRPNVMGSASTSSKIAIARLAQ